nr:EOG090X0BPM [Cyclestheria hislopi]
MVNVCGHALCESCVELLFVKGSGSCPECNIPLRRSNFRVQLFEDSSVDKEVDIRKRVLKDFNKRQEDFASLREYNDYLEEVETIIFNLVNNIDVINTNKQIEQKTEASKEKLIDELMFSDVDAKSILALHAQTLAAAAVTKEDAKPQSESQEEIELEELVELEKVQLQEKAKMYFNEEIEEKKMKLKAKEKLIDELMFSDVDAKSILALHAQTLAAAAVTKEDAKPQSVNNKPTTQFSSGIQIGLRGPQNFLPIPKQEELPLYKYKPSIFENLGPTPPSMDSLESKKYFVNIRAATVVERAGGYTEALSCYRALQEAMCGLFYIPQSSTVKAEEMDTT